MNQAKRNRLIYRLLSGNLYIEKKYILRSSDIETLQLAAEIYEELLFSESLSEYRFDMIALTGIPDFENKLTIMNERQDSLKIEMYEQYLNVEILSKLRKQLDAVKKGINTLYSKWHRFDHLTPEGIAALTQTQFIVSRTLYSINGIRVFGNDFDNLNYTQLDDIISEIYSNDIPETEMRDIARSDLWRSYWNIDKGQLFGKPAILLNNEQRRIIAYSKMYDAAYESSDCPSDTVIEDDDLLDGWFLRMKREREKDKGTKEVDKLLSRHKNDQEVFFPASDGNAAKKIDDLNTPLVKKQKQQRAEIIKQRGQVSELEFPDIQIDLLNKQKGIL